MKLKKEDVIQLGALAQLAIDENTISDVTSRLENVLELVSQLQTADTRNIEPIAHPQQGFQALREDQITEKNDQKAFQKLSKDVHNNLYLVPKVIE
ncbi:MAG: aspartyl/glutamyl-tRNA(Asn/Gln) amidotransferase subunit C [Cellvibrionales bacterium TMED49]|nr:MAG: aspartyl/glutamyl-tRNA(Asn/Gln) amidotransferase subunit C [Cellvibrionales bacterium TMED49]